jgi:hypothetical protein
MIDSKQSVQSLNNYYQKDTFWTEDLAEAVGLPDKCEALSSNPSTDKK